MELVNFAHGEFLMLAMYVAFFAWSLGGLDPVVGAPVAAVALGAVGWLTYHGLIRRVLAAPMLAQIFATFGLGVFLRSGAQFAFGVDFLTVRDPWLSGRVSLGGLFIGLPQVGASLAALGAFLGLYLFLSRSETAWRYCAVAVNARPVSERERKR